MSKKLFYYGSSASFSNLYSNNFDGTNEYATGVSWSDIHFTGGNPFFISIWFKPDTVTGFKQLLNIGFSAAAAEITGIQVYQHNARLYCVQGFLTRYLEIRTNNVLSIGNWYHLVWSKPDENANNSNIYLNNALQTKVVTINTLLSGDLPAYTNLIIGRAGRIVSTFYYDGRIFHTAIGNIAVDATQVSEIYTKKGGDLRTLSYASNVKAAYHFPNGQADYPTWTDYISGNNLTMTNQENTDIDSDVP